MEFLIKVAFYSIFHLELEIYYQDKFQKQCSNIFLNKLPNQIKNYNSVKTFKIKLGGFW